MRLLAGFPTSLQVVEPTESSSRITTTGDRRPACAARHLYEYDTTSALPKGRWKVSHLIRGRGQVPDSSNRTSYNAYRYGLGSVGFQMDYMYNDCDLAPLSFLMNQSTHLPDKSRTTIVFIGDSTMRNQHLLFEELFGKILSSVYLKTNDGLLVRMPEIIAGLQDLTQRHHKGELDNIYILFNAGLHEIDILCNQEFIKSRQRVISIPDANFSCTDQYYSILVSLTQRVLHVPSALSVFQSTSAGWLRWGNYGFAWNPTRTQLYPEAPQACADFNGIAYDVMDEYDVPVIDSFWLTRARSDHREIDKNNGRGKKMVHAGQELNEVLLRQWMSLVLQAAFDKKSSKKY